LNPPNNVEVTINPSLAIPALVSADLLPPLDRDDDDYYGEDETAKSVPPTAKRPHQEGGDRVVSGVVVVSGAAGSRSVRVLSPEQAGSELGMVQHKLRLGKYLPTDRPSLHPEQLFAAMPQIFAELQRLFGQHQQVAMPSAGLIEISSVRVEVKPLLGIIQITWDPQEEELGNRVWIASDVFGR